MANPGSLLDLLPRPRSVEYNALPEFLRNEIDDLRKGGRPLAPKELQELVKLIADLPERIAALGRDMRVETGLLRDALKAHANSNAKVVEALGSLQKEQTASRLWIADHEKRLDAHDVQLGVHAKKHVEHAAEITGVHQRLVVVEQLVTTTTKRPMKSRKKATRK